MVGRRLLSEVDLGQDCAAPETARRRAVLRETVDAFKKAEPPSFYHDLARENLARWGATRDQPPPDFQVEVYPDDWGVIAHRLTRQLGTCLAVLNMANAHTPGGAYVEGAVAQEENMFRRTDCHLALRSSEYDPATETYHPEMTALLTARYGTVYLDAERPRVCIRGPEDRSKVDLGYDWLPEEQVFPFFELRAAAQDLRDGSPFDAAEARRRIAAQLDTLTAHGVRNAVLGAFGCGAFGNPAEQVARMYREELFQRREAFSLVAFAIFSPGYGPDNYTPFAAEFAH